MLTLSHGAGRKYDRASSWRKAETKKSDIERLKRNQFGGHVICEDRRLLVEEAPEAYKDCGKVVEDLVGFGLATRVASLKPLVRAQ